MAWIGRDTTQIQNVSVDIGKVAQPLTPWGMELKYTVLELEAAARVGRPVDQQKFAALQLKHQMDVDQMVYIGDTANSAKGLCNRADVTRTALPNGAGGASKWSSKTPDEILIDVNNMLTATWAASGYAVMPSRILLSPGVYGYISTQKVSNAGNVSILKYILENNLLATSGSGKKLEIYPVKWLAGGGQGGTLGDETTANRAVVYTKEKNRVRYPMTLLQRTPIQYDSIYHKTTYFCKLGQVEVVYSETLSYWDGI